MTTIFASMFDGRFLAASLFKSAALCNLFTFAKNIYTEKGFHKYSVKGLFPDLLLGHLEIHLFFSFFDFKRINLHPL